MSFGGIAYGGGVYGGGAFAPAVVVPPPVVDVTTFYYALSLYYRQTIDREREDIWGKDAVCRLYTVTPGAGEALAGTLTAGWVAHDKSSIEGNVEEYFLEVDSEMIGWSQFRKVSVVKISADDSFEAATTQTFKIAQSGKAVQAGNIYQLRLVSTGE
jgi:hypothetical protein